MGVKKLGVHGFEFIILKYKNTSRCISFVSYLSLKHFKECKPRLPFYFKNEGKLCDKCKYVL
jgi:hypothetical protein